MVLNLPLRWSDQEALLSVQRLPDFDARCDAHRPPIEARFSSAEILRRFSRLVPQARVSFAATALIEVGKPAEPRDLLANLSDEPVFRDSPRLFGAPRSPERTGLTVEIRCS